MTTTRDPSQAANQVRDDVRRTLRLTHAAIDALDPPCVTAHCRRLRSMLWRAQNQKIDLTDRATLDERSEESSCLRSGGTATASDQAEPVL